MSRHIRMQIMISQCYNKVICSVISIGGQAILLKDARLKHVGESFRWWWNKVVKVKHVLYMWIKYHYYGTPCVSYPWLVFRIVNSDNISVVSGLTFVCPWKLVVKLYNEPKKYAFSHIIETQFITTNNA
jgi:hypothetical protein